MDTFNGRLGRRIRELREKAGVTRDRLAEMAGVEPSFVSKLEKGRMGIGLENALRMAAALGVSVSAFAGETQAPPKQARVRRLVHRVEKLNDQALTVMERVVEGLYRD